MTTVSNKTHQPVPTPGRIVIHRTQDAALAHNGSKDHPAIVTRGWSDESCNLKVMPDCGPVRDETSQQLIDPADETAQGWFWPPRV